MRQVLARHADLLVQCALSDAGRMAVKTLWVSHSQPEWVSRWLCRAQQERKESKKLRRSSSVSHTTATSLSAAEVALKEVLCERSARQPQSGSTMSEEAQPEPRHAEILLLTGRDGEVDECPSATTVPLDIPWIAEHLRAAQALRLGGAPAAAGGVHRQLESHASDSRLEGDDSAFLLSPSSPSSPSLVVPLSPVPPSAVPKHSVSFAGDIKHLHRCEELWKVFGKPQSAALMIIEVAAAMPVSGAVSADKVPHRKAVLPVRVEDALLVSQHLLALDGIALLVYHHPPSENTSALPSPLHTREVLQHCQSAFHRTRAGRSACRRVSFLCVEGQSSASLRSTELWPFFLSSAPLLRSKDKFVAAERQRRQRRGRRGLLSQVLMSRGIQKPKDSHHEPCSTMRELVRRRAVYHRSQQGRCGKPNHHRPLPPDGSRIRKRLSVPRLMPQIVWKHAIPQGDVARGSVDPTASEAVRSQQREAARRRREAQEEEEDAFFGVAFDMVANRRYEEQRDD